VTLGIGAVLVGSLLIYASIKGLSIGRLIVGDNTSAASDQSLNAKTS
jgi:hypothetical protein